MKYKHGLTVMRCQPFHKGHERIINRMLEECETVTVILGSIQEHGTPKNPFSFTERKSMVKNVYHNTPHWKRMKVFGLADLNSEMEWADYVLVSVADQHEEAPPVDAYYCGSHYDAHWYRHKIKNIEITDRTEQSFPYVSGTLIRDMCTYQDIRWKLYIHECNWEIVENLATRLMWHRKM